MVFCGLCAKGSVWSVLFREALPFDLLVLSHTIQRGGTVMAGDHFGFAGTQGTRGGKLMGRVADPRVFVSVEWFQVLQD